MLHSHSQNAVLVTFLYEDVFTLTGIEMLKGIKKGPGTFYQNEGLNILGLNAPSYKNTETLVVPIIENTEVESELTSRMAEAMEKYPESNAVLVR